MVCKIKVAKNFGLNVCLVNISGKKSSIMSLCY